MPPPVVLKRKSFPSNQSGNGAKDFAIGTLRYAMWVIIKRAQDEGLPSLRVEEIFRRTKEAASVEEGYYDWSKSKTPLNSISSTATSCAHFLKVGSYMIALNDGTHTALDKSPGANGSAKSATPAATSTSSPTELPAPKSKSKRTKMVRPLAAMPAQASAPEPKAESPVKPPTHRGPGRPPKKKHCAAPAHALPPRSFPTPIPNAYPVAHPHNATVPFQGGVSMVPTPNSTVGKDGWLQGFSPLVPLSPVIPWEEAASVGHCTVTEAVMAYQKLGRWPLELGVRCGDKVGTFLGTGLVRCVCHICTQTTTEGCLFPIQHFEKHSSLAHSKNWLSSVQVEQSGMSMDKWLRTRAQQYEREGVRERRVRIYWVTHGIFRVGQVVAYDSAYQHTIQFENGDREKVMLAGEWLEWEFAPNDSTPAKRKESLSWMQPDHADDAHAWNIDSMLDMGKELGGESEDEYEGSLLYSTDMVSDSLLGVGGLGAFFQDNVLHMTSRHMINV